MKTNLYNQTGEKIGEADLPDSIFGLKMNPDLVNQVLKVQMANSRQVLAHTKGRSEVRGGGKKPWRQKGTGRARHGSIRSPLWKGGGVTFGPTKERNFKLKINKKMKCRALFMVLSGKINDDELILLDDLKVAESRTKIVVSVLRTLKDKIKKDLEKGTLIVSVEKDVNLSRAARNLSHVKTISADSLNVLDLMSLKYVLMTQGAVGVIEKTYKGLGPR